MEDNNNVSIQNYSFNGPLLFIYKIINKISYNESLTKFCVSESRGREDSLGSAKDHSSNFFAGILETVANAQVEGITQLDFCITKSLKLC